MEFPGKAGPRPFPIEGCSGWGATWTATRTHFWHRYVRDNMVILEEGNLPHLRWTLCNMLVPWRYLNGSHTGTAQCKKGVERKWRQLGAKEARAVTSRSFSAYGCPLEIMTSFKYMGRVLLVVDDDWPGAVWNLGKAWMVWRKFLRILSREGARMRVSRFFFKATVQLVLLFIA